MCLSIYPPFYNAIYNAIYNTINTSMTYIKYEPKIMLWRVPDSLVSLYEEVAIFANANQNSICAYSVLIISSPKCAFLL